MDILQPLPIDKWSTLRDSLKRDWPAYAHYYYLVNNATKWKQTDPQFKLQFYCPNADVDCGTFVGLSTQTWYVVYVFAFEESRELLSRALTETTVINWNESVQFAGVHPSCDDVLEDFVRKEGANKNIEYAGKVVTYAYFKPKDECTRIKLSIPEECELGHLDESHIPFIHSVWPHRSRTEPEKSTEFLASMVRLNRGVALFSKENGSLVSWVLHSDWGGLGMLQTVEEQKRKGYGRIVVQAAMKELAEEENLDSFAFAVDKNAPPHKLFEGLGCTRVTTATWHFMEPKANFR